MGHQGKSDAVKRRILLAAVVMTAVATGIAVTWTTAHTADRRMRVHLLENARIAAQTVSLEHVAALSGTTADMQSPDYLLVKNDLMQVRHAIRECRFVYLLGQKPDGDVFFYADSEPVGSKDESPAGQSYEEASAIVRDVFSSGQESTEGPERDRWGVWLSALVPLTRVHVGSSLVVLGIDVDARDWMTAIAASAAIPLTLTIILFIALVSVLLASRRSAAPCADQPVLRRLMLPLAAALFLLVAGFSAALLWHQARNLNEAVSKDIASIPENFSRTSSLQADTLRVAMGFIKDDSEMHAALKARDRERLLAQNRAMFDGLFLDRGIKQLSFYDPNRVNLARFSNPARYGDVVDRFTLVEAQRTGKAVAGLEVGRSGTLSQRLVQPIFEGDRLIGFVELGRSVAEVMQGLGYRQGMNMAVVIHKTLLSRQEWEMNTANSGHLADWDRFPDNVLVYNSLPQWPKALEPFVNAACSGVAGPKSELVIGGTSWRVTFLPLTDASGSEVGHFAILCDTSLHREAFVRLLCIVGAGCLLVLVLLLSFFYVVLRNTDQGIEARALALRESEAKWRSITENSPDSIMLVNLNLEIQFISRSLPDLGIEQLCGKSLLDFMPSESRAWATSSIEQVLKTKKPATYVSQHPQADGSTRYLESTVGPVLCDGEVTALVVCSRDVSGRKRVEDALRQESQFRKAIIANAAEGLCVCHRISSGASWVFTVWNDRMAEITGYTMEEINKLGWFNALRLDLQSRLGIVEILARTQQGEESRGVEWTIIRPDGQERTVLASISPLVSNSPDVHILIIVQDITERKQAERELRERNEQVEAILAASQTGIMIIDAQTHEIIEANPAACAMVGRNRSDVLGSTCHQYLCSEARGNCPISDLGQAMDSSERMLFAADGSRVPILKTVVPIQLGGRHCLLETFVDISDQKRQEEQLRQTLARTEWINRLMVGRETRVVELKRQVNDLVAATGQTPPYDSLLDNDGLETQAGDPMADEPDLPEVEEPRRKYRIDELLDRDRMQQLLDSYCDAVGISSAIIDVEGNVFVGARWQPLCTQFHRVNSETCARCIESDTVLANQLKEGEAFSLYRCRNGLTDAASPIVIDGQHVANIFVGQFFLEPSDEAFFRGQAREFGFDEAAYMQAVSRVPIIPRHKLTAVQTYLTTCARLLAEMGLERMQAAAYESGLLVQAEQLSRVNQVVQSQREAALSLAEDANEARAAAEYARSSLEENEARLRNIVEHSTNMFYAHTPDHVFTYVSPQVAELLGYDPVDFASHWMDLLTDNPINSEAIRLTEKAIETGERQPPYEVEVFTRDGQKKWLEIREAPIVVDGRTVSITGAATDITARNEAESTLREAHQRLAEIIDFLPDATFVIDRDGKVVAWNKAIEEMTGVAKSQMIGKDNREYSTVFYGQPRPILIDLVLKADEEFESEKYRGVHRQGHVITGETTVPGVYGGRGAILWGIASELRDAAGNIVGAIESIRNVTDRKNAEERIREENSFRDAIITNAAEGLCVCHEVAEHPFITFTVWNDRMTEITGCTMEEINSRGWYDTMYPDLRTRAQAVEHMSRMHRGQDLESEEWTITRPDGQVRTLLVSTSILALNQPQTHVLGVVQDVTERKEAEAAFRRHVEEIERFNRLATQRELRIIELKRQVNALSCSAGQTPPFNLDQADNVSEDIPAAVPAPAALPAPECSPADYRIDDLLNRDQVREFLNNYYDTIGISSAIVDLEGNVFVEGHWRRICTEFHRANPRTCARCVESDMVLAGQLRGGEDFCLYQCRNGLTDAASPIIIEGRHVANVFVGQFFLKPPDEAFFRAQAAEFGFDEKTYLDALSEVPVVPDEKLPKILAYLTNGARLVAQLGLDRIRDKAHQAEARRRTEDMDRINRELLEQREAALSLAEDANEARAAAEAAHRSLLESEEKYHRLVDSSPIGIGIARDNRMIYANQALIRMHGFEDFDEFASKPGVDYLTPSSRAFVEELKERSRRGDDGPTAFEVDIVRKDGMTRRLQLSVSSFTTNGEVCAQIAFVDITERKLAAEALQRSEERLRSLIEAARDAIVMMGPEGEVTLWSPGAEAIFGWSQAEALGKSVHELIAPDRFRVAQDCGFSLFQEAGHGPAVGKTLELQARHKDGHEFPVELSLSAVQQAGQWCAVGIVRDISERKELEKRAKCQLQLLQSLMEAIPNPVYYKDTQLRYLGCNEVFAKTCGVPQAEIVGKVVHDIAPKHLADVYHAQDVELLAHPGLQVYQASISTPTGVRDNIIFRKSVFYDTEGHIGGVIGILFDTTELVRTEKALLVKDSALKCAASGIVLIDLDGQVTYVNPSSAKMWGFETEQEVMGRHFLCFLVSKEEATAAYQAALDTGAWRGELMAKRKDGSEFVAQVSAGLVKDEEGKPICVMASILDVTQSRRLNDILDRKQKNLEAIFDAAPQAMLLVNESRRVTRANDTIREMFGKDYPEIVNRHPCRALGCAHALAELPSSGQGPVCQACPLQSMVEAAFESGSPVHGAEIQPALTRDGKDILPWLSVSLESLHIDGDKHILIALHDITGRKEAEQQLRETMDMKSQFISTVSHEVRTPLTAMREAVTIVADGIAGKLTKDQTQFLDIAKRNIDRLARLIDDVLDFQKLSAGKMKFHVQLNAIDKTIDEACTTMRPHAQQKKLDLAIELEAKLPPVAYDHDRMIQVLTNLLSNAIKFTPDGGRVSVGACRRGEELAISISDTGLGIPKEALPKLFTQFYRVHRPGKEIKGTGLGLAIVARIVTEHGGRIDVESEIDKGTTFTVFLPLNPKLLPEGMSPGADNHLENALTNPPQS